MEYAYYPGCTLETTSKSYDVSTRACAEVLKIKLEEMRDWNCCGATATSSVNGLLYHTLNARNLAIAEKMGRDVCVPCSACFKNLNSTRKYLIDNSKAKENVNTALKEEELKFTGTAKARHLLDICVNDVGLKAIGSLAKKPLKGLKVATYYGCQIIRPQNEFDDPENPTLFEKLIEALGAEAVNYPLKTRCCGASLIITKNEVALKMVKNLLKCATDNKADCIVCNCPLCQLNLDAYQNSVNKTFGTNFRIPVLYFTQLMGVAFGIAKKKLGIGDEFVSATELLREIVR